MKNLKLMILACLSFMAFTLGATDAPTKGKVEFFNGSVISAKEKAFSEQKQYFLEFYADWCKPCKWMDENTYSNKNLAEYINENYVAVKVNIDDFDGHALKQKYNVQYLPTIIVFDAEGNLLAKHEKSMNASKLLKTLKDNRTNIATGKPTVKTSRKNSRKKPVESTDYAPSKSKTSTTSYNNSNYETENAASFFSIQVGVYKNANNVFNQVERLKYKFSEPVQVINHKDPAKGIVMYKIVVGKFYSKLEAQNYLSTVKNAGIDGFIKNVKASDIEG